MDDKLTEQFADEMLERIDAFYSGNEEYFEKNPEHPPLIVNRMRSVTRVVIEDVEKISNDKQLSRLVHVALRRVFQLGREDAAQTILKGLSSGMHFAYLHMTSMEYESEKVLPLPDRSDKSPIDKE